MVRCSPSSSSTTRRSKASPHPRQQQVSRLSAMVPRQPRRATLQGLAAILLLVGYDADAAGSQGARTDLLRFDVVAGDRHEVPRRPAIRPGSVFAKSSQEVLPRRPHRRRGTVGRGGGPLRRRRRRFGDGGPRPPCARSSPDCGDRRSRRCRGGRARGDRGPRDGDHRQPRAPATPQMLERGVDDDVSCTTRAPSRSCATARTWPARASPAVAASSPRLMPTVRAVRRGEPVEHARKDPRIYDRIGLPRSASTTSSKACAAPVSSSPTCVDMATTALTSAACPWPNAYATTLGTVFTEQPKPYEVELCVAGSPNRQVFDTRRSSTRIGYDGSVVDETRFLVMGGHTDAITTALAESFEPGLELAATWGRRRRAVHAGLGAGGQRWRRYGSAARATAADLKSPCSTALGRARRSDAWAHDEASTLLDGGRSSKKGLSHAAPDHGYRDRIRGHLHLPGTLRRLSPDEVARYLFRAWCRGVAAPTCSTTVHGSTSTSVRTRYATAECDDILTLINHDRAGEPDPRRPARDAQNRLADGARRRHLPVQEQHRLGGQLLQVSWRTTLVVRSGGVLPDLRRPLPFLVTRQLICGAGKVLA